MSLTCLQIVQTAFRRLGLNQPTAAVTSSDPQTLQMLSLLEEEGQEQANRYPWQTLQRQATFTTVATQVQTTLAAITTGFDYIVNDTIWNRDLRRPVYGPRSQQDWQQDLAMSINGPFNEYRVIADAINFYPVPVAGQACYFEYMTRFWINGESPSATFTADTDTIYLDEQATLLGLIWRWKAMKGLDYSQDFSKYEARIMDNMGRDASKPTLNMNGAWYEIVPAIAVPRGSWNT
jgi:hypothetical protein